MSSFSTGVVREGSYGSDKRDSVHEGNDARVASESEQVRKTLHPNPIAEETLYRHFWHLPPSMITGAKAAVAITFQSLRVPGPKEWVRNNACTLTGVVVSYGDYSEAESPGRSMVS